MGAAYDALPTDVRAAHESRLAQRRELGRLTKAELIDRVMEMQMHSEFVAQAYGSPPYTAPKHEIRRQER